PPDTPENFPTIGNYGDTLWHPDSGNALLPADNDTDVMSVLAVVWVAGVILLVFYFAFSYWRLRRQISTAVILRDNIFQSERIGSPFVLGIVKPRIYLPFEIDGQNLEYVISHEQAHIRRRDHWWKSLGFLLLAVYWFNPLMWLSYVLLCRDIELACDEKVIQAYGSRQRADYSQALLACSVSRSSITACPLAFGEVGVKERVKSVLNYRKPAFWIIIAALIACVVVAVGFLTDPAQRQDTLIWAQRLSVDDIKSADLVVFPQIDVKQYKSLSEEEIISMVALINESKGKYVTEYEERAGGVIAFYITMQDGSTHEVRNIGNAYLVIDQDYYEAQYSWLNTWYDNFSEGNSLLPEGYFLGQPASDNEPESVPEEAAPDASPIDTVIWETADLDHDGETETIHIRETIEDELYELEVVKKDGTLLWSTEAGIPHVGWNTILLYQDNGMDYLVEYHPTVYQGMGNYTCRIFSLEGGQELEDNYWEAAFELSTLQVTSKMQAFAERANDFLKYGTLLLSTVEGELIVGPRAAEEISLLYPVRFFPESAELMPPVTEASLDELLPLEFLFASGAGSWGTTLTLYPDGHFEGSYEDGENIAAPEYPRGTSYYCRFSGKFSDITKVSEYAYSMRLVELTYETEVDKEWIEDQHRYIGSDALGLTGGEEFMLYLPGTPLEGMDEEFIYWWPDYYLWRDGSVHILSSYGIQNVSTNQGFFTSWLE
ncbi:MAG: M56 family metallopeptidase, partial [Acetatifactor sp.]|nr:M56 family metallopeptidase [Acetatifactor sp.]